MAHLEHAKKVQTLDNFEYLEEHESKNRNL